MALKDKTISYLLSILLFLLMSVVNGVPQETICKFTVDPLLIVKPFLPIKMETSMTMVTFQFENPYPKPVNL
jgi:hypothetical protein